MKQTLFLLLSMTVLSHAEPEKSLTKAEAEAIRDKLATEVLAKLKTERAAELDAKAITIGEKTLKWLEKDYGKGKDGKSCLFISLHGGGSGPKEMNDQQWQNQMAPG